MKTYIIKNISFFFLFCVFLFSSCTEEVEKIAGKGSVIIGVQTDATVITKSETEFSASEFPVSLRITQISTGKVTEYVLDNGYQKEIELETGEYRIDAVAGDDPKGKPTTEPYYAGSKIITVVEGKNNPVEIVCKLTTVVIKVDNTGLQRYYDARYECETVVATQEGEAITFKKEDSQKSGYFVPGKLSVTFRYKKGTNEWVSEHMGDIIDVAAQYKYIITYEIKDGNSDEDGSAGIGISIGEDPENKEGSIIIELPELTQEILDLEDDDITDSSALIRVYASLNNGEQIGNTIQLKYAEVLDGGSLSNENSIDATKEEDNSYVAKIEGLDYFRNYKVWIADDETKVKEFMTKPLQMTFDYKANPWATFAILSANDLGIDFSEFNWEYRKEGEGVWNIISQDNSEVKINGLGSNSKYEYRLVSKAGDKEGNIESFTTEEARELPNASFEDMHQDGSAYYFYKKGDINPFWGTGNKGSTTLGDSYNITTQSTDYVKKGTYSAKLSSIFAGVLGQGKFAAGNLFAGEYVETLGSVLGGVDKMGGRLEFGRPFTSRPSKLTGYLKYTAEKINYVGVYTPQELKDEGAVDGQTDKAHIYVALADKGEPYTIINSTADNYSYQLFDKDDPNVIAYGEVIYHDSTEGNDLIPFEVVFEYRSLERIPDHIIIVCSASKYGDYFTGAGYYKPIWGTTKQGSVLWLDDFELIYDEPVLAD